MVRAGADTACQDPGAAAIEVLRTAVELGVDHIDTADAYAPYVTNEIIREALFPYGDHLHIVTKVGLVRDERGSRLPATSPEALRGQVIDNLRRLGLDQFETLAELQQKGLIRHLGLSTVSLDQAGRGAADRPGGVRAELLQHRQPGGRGDADGDGGAGIAYVPYFPLGGFSPLQSKVLESVARRLGATPTAVAQSWLLRRSPNVLLIPGTSSVAPLRENIGAAALTLPPDAVAELDAIRAGERLAA